MVNKSGNVFKLFVDMGTIVLCWFLAYCLRFYFLTGAEAGLEPVFAKLAPLLIILTVYNFYRNDLYSFERNCYLHREMFRTLKGNIAAILLFVVLLYFFEENRVSRMTIGIYGVLSSIMLLWERTLFFRAEQREENILRVLLVGDGPSLKKYIDTIRGRHRFKTHIIGHVGPGVLEREGIHVFSDYEQARRDTRPDMVLLSYEDGQKNMDFLARHYNDVVSIKFLPDLSHSLIGCRIEEFEGIPMMDFNAPSFNPLDIILKRILDMLGSLCGLVLLSPLLLLIGFLVKLSSKGPVFYGQSRVGLGGRTFTMWKFRTMSLPENEEEQREWSSPHHPRKTVVGGWLRRTSLDELPQLWNVFKGDMGLIGPRPEQPHFVDQFQKDIPGYMLRHKVRPGISGWAQINGWRGDTDMFRRIECDIFYIKNWSLWFDLKIIFFTFFKGFVNKNAY